MVTLPMLWLPILLSTVFVFIAANILWMALPFWHRLDYGKIENDGPILEVLKDVKSGQYMLPTVDWSKMTPEESARIQAGPGGLLLVRNPSTFNFASKLVSFFIYNAIVATFIAYMCRLALPSGASYPHVFRVAATAGFLAYSFNTIPDSIWYAKPWAITIRYVIDGVVYGLLIGGTFGWLWPH